MKSLLIAVLISLYGLIAGCSRIGDSTADATVDPDLIGTWENGVLVDSTFEDIPGDSSDLTITTSDIGNATGSFLMAGGALYASEGNIYVRFQGSRIDLYSYLIDPQPGDSADLLFMCSAFGPPLDLVNERDSSGVLVFRRKL